MRRAAAAVALVLSFVWGTLPTQSTTADRRVVVDDAGRRVEVPAKVTRVFAAGGPASIIVYTLAPDTLAGWPRALTADERTYVPAGYADLPTLGRLTGRGSTANAEVVLQARPDVIVDYGSVTATYASVADRIQQQTGIPYLLLDGRLESIPTAYARLGELLGTTDTARELARYAERVLGDVSARVARVAPERRPRFYYARGPRGLDTAAHGSINVEGIERLGAVNVVTRSLGSGNLGAASVEQVLAWDPEIIITIDPRFMAAVRHDPAWRGVRAVRDGRVHLVPLLPFPWVDSPPSVNRLIGLTWLGRLLYPELFGEDLRRETRAFYALFYHRTPDDRQLDELLGAARLSP